MQPILFLQSGDTGTIKRISGAEDTRRFLAGLGFVENAEVTVISQFDGNLIVNVKDSRIAVNEEYQWCYPSHLCSVFITDTSHYCELTWQGKWNRYWK